MKRLWLGVSLVLVLTAVMSGCTKAVVADPLEAEDATVKIGFGSEESFKERYGNTLDQKYPNLTYSIVPTVEMARGRMTVEQWVKENEADVIFVPRNQIEEFVRSGLLLNLDALIKQHEFDLDAFYPRVIEYARDLGNGSIYGIPPTMYGSVIAYNKDVFDLHGIAYPQNQMTWEELLRLAQQFPEKGLAVEWTSADQLAWSIGTASGLKVYESNASNKEETGSITIATESWEKVWSLAAETSSTEALVYGDQALTTFFEGQSAMAVLSSFHFKRLTRPSALFKWDLVTMPINPNDPEVSMYAEADGIYAISALTASPETAFKLLQFLLSPAISKWEQIGRLDVPTLMTNQLQPFAETLYQLRPVGFADLPIPLFELGEAAMKEMIEQDKPVSQVLQQLQVKATQAHEASKQGFDE